MQIQLPDPGYTGSERRRAHFRLAAKISGGFVAVIWVVFLLNWASGQDAQAFGIRPREWDGLPGIVFAPLVHDSFDHIVSNTPPLWVLGTAMLFLYPSSSLRVFPAVYFGTGIAVWLFGRDATHFGASGLVYGLVSHVFVAGLLRRDRRAVAASLLVCFLYGSLLWGVFPTAADISWETHLSGALIGVVSALTLRRLDVAPPKRYAWEAQAGAGQASESPATVHAGAFDPEAADGADPARGPGVD